MNFQVGDLVQAVDLGGNINGLIGVVQNVDATAQPTVYKVAFKAFPHAMSMLENELVKLSAPSWLGEDLPGVPSCHCQNLLAGHDERCSYHKQDYEDPRTRTDLWGIKRVEAKTRAEINAAHSTKDDLPGFGWGGRRYAFPKGQHK